MTSAALTRPESFQIGRVFNNTFSVIRRNFLLCLVLALLFAGLPRLVLDLFFWNPAGGLKATAQELSAQQARLTILALLSSMVFSAILQAALVRAAIADLNGKRPSIGDCFGTALYLILPVVGVAVLVALGLVLGLMLLVVPGIILWLRWSVSVPVMVGEHRGVFDSMARSRDLTKGHRWALFGFWIVIFAAAFGLQLVLTRFVAVFGMTAVRFLELIMTVLVSVVTSIAPAVTYVELRQIKEGTSINELAEIFS
jgi:uncharacterized membrane protein